MTHITIGFSEVAVGAVDSAVEEFREKLCGAAERAAQSDGSNVVLLRHILQACDHTTSNELGAEKERESTTQASEESPNQRSREPLTPSNLDWSVLEPRALNSRNPSRLEPMTSR